MCSSRVRTWPPPVSFPFLSSSFSLAFIGTSPSRWVEGEKGREAALVGMEPGIQGLQGKGAGTVGRVAWGGVG